MKRALDIARSEIILLANNAFHLDIVEVEFIPIGEASWLYKARASNDELYVIKIQRSVAAAPSEVLAQLAETKYRWVPESLMTDDSMLWAKGGEYFYSVQRYIATDNLHHAASEPDDHYLHELGVALKELHGRSLDRAKLPNITVEDFNPTVFDDAKGFVVRLSDYKDDNPNIHKVQTVFENRQQYINQLFENMRTYGDELKERSDFTVVHGDMHFGNVLKPVDDHLYLIDWDHTMLSLPEMDLMYLTDTQIERVSEAYGKDFLNNRTAIQYYRNFLLVRAIDFFLGRLFDPRHTNDAILVESIAEIFDMSPYVERALRW